MKPKRQFLKKKLLQKYFSMSFKESNQTSFQLQLGHIV